MIHTRCMVGHKIDNHLQPALMDSLHAGLELRHSAGHIHCKSRRHIIVILEGIRASGLPFNHIGIVGRYGAIEERCLCGHLNHACEPKASHTEVGQALYITRSDIVQFSGAILFECAPGARILTSVGMDSRECLIYDKFLFHSDKIVLLFNPQSSFWIFDFTFELLANSLPGPGPATRNLRCLGMRFNRQSSIINYWLPVNFERSRVLRS